VSAPQTILEEKCSALLREKEVLFAGLISKHGKLVSGGFKPGVNLVDELEKEIMFMEHALMATMTRDFDSCLGRVLYTASKREKTTLINFSMGTFLFLVAVDPVEDIEKETNKIQKIINGFALHV
jgi:hypothetical protein